MNQGSLAAPVRPTIRCARQGFTLIEILVATTIFAVGILTVAAATNLSMRAAERAMRSSDAAIIADSELESAIHNAAVGQPEATDREGPYLAGGGV